MSETDATPLPKYFKDADGFCYIATPQLAKLNHLTPWDGEVDERGHATEKAAEKPTKKTAAKE